MESVEGSLVRSRDCGVTFDAPSGVMSLPCSASISFMSCSSQ